MVKVDERTTEQKLNDALKEIERVKEAETERRDVLVQHLMGVLNMYLACGEGTISVLAGRNIKVDIKFHGPITGEVISDVMAHLGFYRKYFPKDESAADCLTAEKLIEQFRRVLAEADAAR